MKHFQLILILVFVLSLFLAGCSYNVPTNVNGMGIESTFQALLEETLYSSFDNVPGVAMSVFDGDDEINWTGAAGFDSMVKIDSITSNQTFRIASVSKTFVAAAILRLHEMDSLSIHDKIADYISETHIDLLQKGGYDMSQITIRQCLNHTSGLYDYALGGRTYIEMIINDPQRKWTRTDQIKVAVEAGSPLGRPGEKYGYSDTGYILLGEAIEAITDTTLAASLRSLLHYSDNGLNTTWLESAETHRSSNMSLIHSYLAKHDATEWDASIDIFGGGGLVSTSRDLAKFMMALFNDRVYGKSNTLDLMLQKVVYKDSQNPEIENNKSGYRLGIEKETLFW